ncbi:hypothetical protein M378DRAFT_118929 [Amanita muscaria Koide BX008]|uniref:Pirin N-terminal domain-containing protein n=1 Tax=Amanita muscaria (strain Koide BX008) TaxID=946122 RepID=A0A0C2TPE7_AMAMK|nr:hypothetical protein M378DRAFT_118929 [Amanita muscaria Koide BX008]
MATNAIKIVPRLSQNRGHADHGWLKTFHTFSFSSYHDPKHASYGPLRVINEDRVAPKRGFGTHSHREFEIFSYIVSGELEHKDSMGNTEILPRGSIQMTSAGTGISHSEHSHGNSPVHFLQIWSLPHTSGLTPTYYTRTFSDSAKQNKWARVVAPVGAEGVEKKREAEGPAPVHSGVTMYASLLDKGVKLPLEMKGKKGYVHVIMTSGYKVGPSEGAAVKLASGPEEVIIKEGDGAYLQISNRPAELVVENVADGTAEVLVFDIE